MDPKADRVSTEQALAIYAEALVARGVIAVLGDASAGVGELLVRLGARAVYLWDPDEQRALGQADLAPRGVTVRPLVREDLVRRDFDLVIVPDLAIFDDPGGLLADVRRMVGEEGAALVAAPNREVAGAGAATAFDYYELFDVVAQEFDYVRMIAQLPFRGVTLAELGDDADTGAGVSVDTQLGEEATAPDVFVALASQRDVRLDPYSIVQLAASPPSPQDEPSSPGVAAVAEPDAGLLEELNALRRERAERAERADAAAALEAALAERTRQANVLAHQLEEAQAAAQAGRLAAAEELDELIGRVDRAEHKAAELQGELSHAETHSTDHAGLEETLRDRARVIRALEDELARRDQLVRELAGALEDASGTPPHPAAAPDANAAEELAQLRGRLDALALDLARREGEARAAAWTIEELEGRLALAERAAAASSPAGDPAAGARLAVALDELDALRLALVQEHAARLEAESRHPGRAVDAGSGPAGEGADLGAQPQER